MSGAPSAHRSVLRGLVVVGTCVALAKLAAAGKEAVVADAYGSGAVLDGFLMAFALVQTPLMVWGALVATLVIPLAADLARHEAGAARRWHGELLGAMLGIAALAAIATWLLLPPLIDPAVSGLSPTGSAAGAETRTALAVTAGAGVLIGLLSAWTMAGNRHLNSMAEALPAVAIAVAVLAVPSPGASTLAWGTAAGCAAQAVVLALPLHRRGELPRPRLAWQSPAWSAFRRGCLAVLLGQSLMAGCTLVDQFAAARLGDGAVSILGYANRLVILICGLSAVAVTRALLPVASAMDASANRHALAGRWAIVLGAAGVGAALAGWWLAEPVVRLLFERGAFTPEDTAAVAGILRIWLLQMPFYLAGQAMMTGLAADRRFATLAWAGLATCGAKIATLAATIGWLGLSALPWSSVAACAAGLAVCLAARR